jgi:hypothetical protein
VGCLASSSRQSTETRGVAEIFPELEQHLLFAHGSTVADNVLGESYQPLVAEAG